MTPSIYGSLIVIRFINVGMGSTPNAWVTDSREMALELIARLEADPNITGIEPLDACCKPTTLPGLPLSYFYDGSN
tara:strand:- start:316 stop:543 length:228 start_codon:yes stop_codon:yes gene_type:complete